MKITLKIDGMKPIKRKLMFFEGMDADKIAAAAAPKVEALTKNHFKDYGTAHPNKLGGLSTGYWLRASNQTIASSSGSRIEVEVVENSKLKGLRRHYTGGGVIRPKGISEITNKPITRLTIPVNPAAHGMTVAMLRAKGIELYREGGVLKHQVGAEKNESDPKMFILAKSVKAMQPNPSIIPTPVRYSKTIAEILKIMAED